MPDEQEQINEELRKENESLKSELNDLRNDFEDLKTEYYRNNFTSEITYNKDVIMKKDRRIRFPIGGSSFEMYREDAAGDRFYITPKSTVTGNAMYFGGDADYRADYTYVAGTSGVYLNAVNGGYQGQIDLSPARCNISTNYGSDFYLSLPNHSSDPSTSTVGALAMVNGKLKVRDSSSWVVAGTQS